jgi:hypothetical protein
MEDLLEESQIRSVPGTEHIADMRAVTHHLLAFRSGLAVPLSEGNSVYPCFSQI